MGGLGFNLSYLGGNAESVKTLHEAKGGVIKSAAIDAEVLRLAFEDGRTLEIYDDAQSCCEVRHMSTDDKLDDMIGSMFVEVELAEAQPDTEKGEYGEAHERLFLDLKTSKGVFTLVSHNEHNGYYGGIMPRLRWGS